MSFPAEASDESSPSHRQTRVYWWIAVLGWTALIFFSSTSLAEQLAEEAFNALSVLLFGAWRSAPGLYNPIHLLADKGVHVTLFAIFAVLLWQALPDFPRKLRYVILAGTVVGCGSEFLQQFFPGRDPALRDVCINAVATACGAVMSGALFRSKSKPAVILV